MAMRRSKRGFFFTLAAITISLILLISLNRFEAFELTQKSETVAVRINSMNTFIKDVEQDLEKGLFISSFRSFASMVQYIASNGTYIDDMETAFEELTLTGMLNGEQPSLMQDSTFTDWANKISVEADKIGILVNFTIHNVTIHQDDPWNVIVTCFIDLTVRDEKNTSSWNRTNTLTARVGITNFEDPLYLVNSFGRVTNVFTPSPITQFVDLSGDTMGLNEQLNKSYYIASPSGPNFIMRLQGNLSNATTGIESLVNLGTFQEQGIGILDRSAVDYIYFGSQSTTNFRINNTPSWFKLDDDHLSVYQAENVTI